MNEELSSGFRIKDWEIWPLRNLLNGPDGEHHIEPKAMQVLVALASQPGEVVSRESLLDEVWPDTYSGEVSLTRCVSQLRHQFSDERGNSEFIETIPKTGYRLVAPVKAFADEKSQDRPRSNTWVAVAIAVLFLGFGYLVIDRYVLNPDRNTVTVKAVIPADNSIAVLPFVNVSDDSGNDYFSSGVSDDIRNLLSKIPELQVTSRTSVIAAMEKGLDMAAMAAMLNVAHVLEGTVRKSGDQLRITAQLIDVETDTHTWAETYDPKLKDVFAVQDEIAAAVVDALKLRLLSAAPKSTKTSPEAYALYLQGRHLMKQLDKDSIQMADTLLNRSLGHDPDFVPALTALAALYRRQADPFGLRPVAEGDELAHQVLQKALAIDPKNEHALAILAVVERDPTAAYRYMQQAVTSNPGDAGILRRAGWMEFTHGRMDKAIEQTQRSNALDPISPAGYINLGFMYFYTNRLDEAIEQSQMVLSLNPDAIMPHYLHGLVLLAQGNALAALLVMQQEPDNAFRLHGISLIQHALGNTAASNTALQELIDCCAIVAAYQLAEAYAFRGEIDKAFEWLNQAYENEEDWGLIPTHAPLLANLHKDPHWEHFLEKWGLAH